VQNGQNLFHSFEQFNLHKNEIATFSGPDETIQNIPPIQNIISRVTGGKESWINGTIRSTIPNSNLYLLNPSGIMFGPDARLDIEGSFHASTADYLKFTDSNKFYSNGAVDSVLTMENPSAFGFLDDVSGEGAGSIYIRSKTLSMVDSSLFAQTYGMKDGAEININIDGMIYLEKGTKIFADTYGKGKGADINIFTNESIVLRGENDLKEISLIRYLVVQVYSLKKITQISILMICMKISCRKQWMKKKIINTKTHINTITHMIIHTMNILKILNKVMLERQR